MKLTQQARRILIIAGIGLAIVAAFFTGRYWEHFQNGRWYRVHAERIYHWDFGAVHLHHVTDSIGWPFLDPGDSVISMSNGSHHRIKLYQSKRDFQESWPWVHDLEAEGNQLRWSDGVYRYRLGLELIDHSVNDAVP
ncbi:MAG: hypothetical protein JJU36_06925 [Phycisphaeraceae bacterium]|nr:hypothetical protein [Phycisphaeraceae bacterium]